MCRHKFNYPSPSSQKSPSPPNLTDTLSLIWPTASSYYKRQQVTRFPTPVEHVIDRVQSNKRFACHSSSNKHTCGNRCLSIRNLFDRMQRLCNKKFATHLRLSYGKNSSALLLLSQLFVPWYATTSFVKSIYYS